MQHRELREDLLTGFGRIRPTSFGSTVDSSTLNIPYRSPFDPRNDPNDPWARKGAGPGFTPPEPATAPEPEPESQPQTFFERFPTPQEAWQDWIARMGQFLARQPGETPNFPGPWGTPQTSDEARQAAAKEEVRRRREINPPIGGRIPTIGQTPRTFGGLFTF